MLEDLKRIGAGYFNLSHLYNAGFNLSRKIVKKCPYMNFTELSLFIFNVYVVKYCIREYFNEAAGIVNVTFIPLGSTPYTIGDTHTR